MPILLKEDGFDSKNLDNMKTLPVFATSGFTVPLAQVVDSFAYDYHYNVIKRYNRDQVMMAQCDPKRGANTKAAFSEVWNKVKSMNMPEGYRMKIFGEGRESGGVQRGFGCQYAVDVYLNVYRVAVAFQNVPETDNYIADGAVDFYRGGLRFAGDGENVRLFSLYWACWD